VLTRVMGAENEYALTALDARGRPLVRDDTASRLVRQLGVVQPVLLDGGGGVFLVNGARCYVDCGHHPEYSTPECTDPHDVVRHIKAGERLLCEAAERLEQSQRGLKALLFRTNVDHSGSGATWGAHESYMHTATPDRLGLVRNLLPHLVSRIIYTGAGGFDPTSHGLRFMISPRALFFEQAVSGESTGNRGIFHTKNEPLATPDLQRLHVVCGESLGSARASVLKFGTTALIVALIDQGLQPGIWLDPKDPVAAFHQVAGDLELKSPIPLVDGGRMTALQMQRHYLAEVSRRVGEPYMPGWAEAIVKLWAETLDALEQGVEAVASKLDWAMRYALCVDRARRAGFEWEQARLWTEVIDGLVMAARMTGYSVQPGDVISQLVGPDSPIVPAVRTATKRIQAEGLNWDDAQAFLAQRAALLEVDLRFGQLGDAGLFAILDRGGYLTHAVAGVERIAEAMGTAPADTRAGLRGDFVRRASSIDRTPLVCSWNAVWNRCTGKVLDMSSPFASRETWRHMTLEEARAFGYRGVECGDAAAGA
jgi:hypothetical protein